MQQLHKLVSFIMLIAATATLTVHNSVIAQDRNQDKDKDILQALRDAQQKVHEAEVKNFTQHGCIPNLIDNLTGQILTWKCPIITVGNTTIWK